MRTSTRKLQKRRREHWEVTKRHAIRNKVPGGKYWEALVGEADTYPAEAEDDDNIIGNADPSRLPAKV